MKYLIIFILVVISCFYLSLIYLTPKKIENGDIVKKCIIDSMFVTESTSTIEYGKRYHYVTDCDEFVITKRSDVYDIGDTITFVYKKK